MRALNKVKHYAIILGIFAMLTQAAFADDSEYKRLYQEGNFTNLIDKLEKKDIKTLSPDLFTFYVYSLSREDLDDAEDIANEAIEVHPNNADMFLMHADIMGQQAQDSIFSALGYAEKALTSLQKAAELEPQKPKYRQGLMTFYLAAPSIAGGDTDLALVQAKAISELDKERGSAAMAMYYQAIEDEKSALESLQSGLAEFPDSLALYAQLSSYYLNKEEHENAINTLVKASAISLEKPSDAALEDDEIRDEYENQVLSLLNSHYQIGRIALLGEVKMKTGISHLDTYISLYDQTDISLNGLPSKEWAYLRRSALLYETGQIKEASDSISFVTILENDRMKKIHKTLNKKIKKAMKKMS